MTSETQQLPVTVRWWALVIRGLAGIVFGLLTFAQPSISLLALVTLWGAYAIVDGLFSIVLSIRGARIVPASGWFFAEGLVSIAAGVATILWPGITAYVLLAVIAFWAIVTGIVEIASAIRLRRLLRDWWLLAASGVLSIALGGALVLNPGHGALAVTWLIGAYAILVGALLIALGFRLHRWTESPDHPASPERAPTRA